MTLGIIYKAYDANSIHTINPKTESFISIQLTVFFFLLTNNIVDVHAPVLAGWEDYFF